MDICIWITDSFCCALETNTVLQISYTPILFFKLDYMLAPGKKSYDKPRQHIKKQRHYFANKICLVKAMVFPVVIHGCESWTIKKAEHQRIDAFEPSCWRRLLKSPGQQGDPTSLS